MSTNNPRWVIADDTSPDIHFLQGSWFEDSSGSQDAAGNFGPVFQGTLHGVRSGPASLAYAFTGSSVRVFGSNNIQNNSGTLNPSWECFVDNVSIGSNPFQFPENNWVFCDKDGFSDGPHVLTVNATVANPQTFWIDQIQYVPSANVLLDNPTILIDSLDSQLSAAYGDGWTALGGSANMTGKTGSKFTFSFSGVSLSWFGFIPKEFPIASTTGTYSIDGQNPTNFLLKGLPNNGITIYNQKFFQTPSLSPGQHQIVVTYEGSSQTTPLTLDYLVVQNASGVSTPNSPVSVTAISSTPSTTAALPGTQNVGAGSKSNIGAITGGVVGGFSIIVLAVLAYLYIRRRDKELGIDEKDGGANAVPRPFIYSPVATSHSRSSHSQGSRGLATATTSTPQPSSSGTAASRHHFQHPSFSLTEISQSFLSPSPSSSGAAASPGSLNAHTNGVGNTMGQSTSTTNVPAATTSPHPWHPSLRSEKFQREAAATVAALRQQRRGEPGQAPLTSPPLSDDSSSSRYVHHEDSGIRMAPVVEVPPEYTAL